ncbi:hypothetical protein SK224_16550 [Microbacterium sp. BG28]|uniref:hypothetical protein n=1 Tax=Microbacterium sp. BG28 TaxID=3097356 RepID=UPI002A5AC38A|nr:hypothetical protein [Microbacterium sp. BG28]MDY0830747.1 hypothetical protein [Microbacterium sp. BG28]
MRDRRSIRADRAAGSSIRGIARATGASRNAVRRALDPDANLDYTRPSMAEEYTPAVRDVLADYPRISVNQVAEIVEWPGARRTLSDLVAQLRPAALEREREDLNRPTLGTVHVGIIRFGPMTVGRMTVGSVHGVGEDDQLGPA